MARGHWIALGTAAAITGCGGPSAEEKRADQAGYVRAADRVCETANRAVARHEQRPKDIVRLSYSIRDTRRTLTDSSDRLHKLHGQLDDASSRQLDAFDGALEPYLKAIDTLTVRVLDSELKLGATMVRRRGNAMYRAAQAAGLRRCGRGGNAIAERAVFVVYRRGYSRADVRARKRLASAARLPAGPNASDAVNDAANRRNSRALSALYRDHGRLTPPRRLRTLHQSVRRRLATVLARRRQLDRNESYQRYLVLNGHLRQEFRRYARVERRLRQQLNR